MKYTAILKLKCKELEHLSEQIFKKSTKTQEREMKSHSQKNKRVIYIQLELRT